jgi:PAS domain S-box-containing protein
VNPWNERVRSRLDWLVEQALSRADDAGDLRDVPASRDVWVRGVERLSRMVIHGLEAQAPINPFQTAEHLATDPVAAFVSEEARAHRYRGVSLAKFLAVLKHFRGAFLDLVESEAGDAEERTSTHERVLALFDRLELAFCVEWVDGASESEDLQELKASGRILNEEKARFMALLESLPSPVFLLDAASRIEYCNPSAWFLFGGADTRGTLRGRPIVELAPGVAVALAALDQSQGDDATVERRIETRQGVRHMDVRISRTRDVRRIVNGTAVVLNDVTLRREVEVRLRRAREELEASVRERTEELEDANGRLRDEVRERGLAEAVLRESEERYRSLVDLSPDGIIVHSNGVVVFVNPSALRMCGGVGRESFEGRQVLDFVHPDDRAKVVGRVRRMVETGGGEPAMGERFLRVDGTDFDVEVTASGILYQGVPSVQVVFRDISDRVRLDREAEERRRAVEVLLEARDRIALVEPEATGPLLVDAMMRSCCAESAEWFALDPVDGILRGSASIGLLPEVAAWVLTQSYDPTNHVGFMASVLLSREPIYLADCASDPRWRPQEAKTRSALFMPVRFGDRLFGVALLMSSAVDGFPESRRALGVQAADYLASALESARLNAQTREAEARYRSTFENAVEGIYQCVPPGRILVANPALARILGFDNPQDLLQDPTDFLDRLYVDPARRADFLREMTERGVVRGFEYEARRVDGQRVWVSESARAVRDESGAIVRWEGVVEDVSRRKELESQLQQAQKMEAVGRLAGGVAHDFNNLLTAILGYSGLLLDRLDPGEPAWRDVQEVREAGKRAAALTGQLLAFSRKQVLQPMVLDLTEVVSAIEKLLRRLIGEHIELRTTLSAGPLRVKVDPSQLDQVIINLALNGRDAMPNGGSLSIGVEPFDLADPLQAENLGLAPGRYALLTFVDTGTGMDEETQSHLFEPFYTTKGPGKGTGLGLAVVYGIVKQSGGHIWFESRAGRGTIMKVCLPRIEGAVVGEAPAESQPTRSRGVETVLVAEDEAAVRGLVRVVLESAGYRVLEACDGREALEVSKAHEGEVHLLVSDVIMPGMNGRDLSRSLRRVRPGLRVLFTSGYTDSVVVQPGLLMPGTSFLQKPFAPATLLEVVRDLLDRSMEMPDEHPVGS